MGNALLAAERMKTHFDWKDSYARPGTKVRRVLDALADGGWHSGVSLHQAFGIWGWTFDSALAQLRAKGLLVESRPLNGRREFAYRLVVPAVFHLKRQRGQVRCVAAQFPLPFGETT